MGKNGEKKEQGISKDALIFAKMRRSCQGAAESTKMTLLRRGQHLLLGKDVSSSFHKRFGPVYCPEAFPIQTRLPRRGGGKDGAYHNELFVANLFSSPPSTGWH